MFIDFSVDRTSIRPGECVTFRWHVEGVRAVYFYREGERWQNHGVVGLETRQECPSQSTTYCLRVVKTDNSVEIRQIPIQVQPAGALPAIQHFRLDPPGPIILGGCVDLYWSVSGQVDRVRIIRKRKVLWDNAPMSGSRRDCPGKPGNVPYTLEVTGPGGTSQAQQVIQVIEHPTPPAPQPPPPQPDKPAIRSFTVSPPQIRLGECVTINWQTGGATSWVTIVRGEHIVWDNAPLSGSVQDCPDTSGEVGYRLVAFNPEDERVRQDRTIKVSP